MTQKKHIKQQNLGFTLIEVLLAIAIISLLGGLSIPIYQSFETRDSLDVTVNTVTLNMRRAQALSMASSGNSSWGVTILPEQVVLYKGVDYAQRDLDFDEIFDISADIVVSSGPQEISYSKLNGTPSETGSIVLRNSSGSGNQNLSLL